MRKRYMSMEDLYHFFVGQNKDFSFNSKDSDGSIIVHVNELYNYSDEQNDELNLYTKLRLCHTLYNRNKSYISEKAMKKAIPSAYNMPILGYIWHDPETDEDVFASHEFYEDEDGEIIYEEIPIGTISSEQKLTLSDEDEEGKRYLEGTGIIWRTYTKAAEILEREQELSVSVELSVESLSYDAKTKVLSIDDFKFTGVTILQKSRYDGSEVKPGMVGANITLADFSENNSMVTTELLEELRKLNKNFETLKTNSEEGGNMFNKELFAELLEKYQVTEDQIEFEYENLSDEELTQKFAEMFKEDESEETSSEDTANDNEDSDAGNDVGNDDTDNSDNSADSDNDGVEDATDDSGQVYSLTMPDGTVKTFSLSLNDVQNALFELVNDTYSEMDNDIYSVDVYPDDKKVVMQGWFGGQNYRQTYKRKKDNFSLDGERVSVHAEWLSEDEQKILNDAKANFEETKTKLDEAMNKLSAYESEPEKVAVFESSEWDLIKDTAEFKELTKRENYFNLTKEEITNKLNEMVLSFAKNPENMKFSENKGDDKIEDGAGKVGNNGNKPMRFNMRPVMPVTRQRKSRYGNLFNREN